MPTQTAVLEAVKTTLEAALEEEVKAELVKLVGPGKTRVQKFRRSPESRQDPLHLQVETLNLPTHEVQEYEQECRELEVEPR